MARRNDHRLRKLEDRRAEIRARRDERDEREEKGEAVLEELRSTPGGAAAEEDLAGRLRERGGVVGVLRAEGGREAVSAFRNHYFAAQGRVKNGDELEVGNDG